MKLPTLKWQVIFPTPVHVVLYCTVLYYIILMLYVLIEQAKNKKGVLKVSCHPSVYLVESNYWLTGVMSSLSRDGWQSDPAAEPSHWVDILWSMGGHLGGGYGGPPPENVVFLRCNFLHFNQIVGSVSALRNSTFVSKYGTIPLFQRITVHLLFHI